MGHAEIFSLNFQRNFSLDHAVTTTQKTILGAFDLNENDVKRAALSISDRLKAIVVLEDRVMAKKNRLELIDEEIKKKQDKMFALKGQIDKLADEVQELLKQKEQAKKEGIMIAIEQSGRTYDEILGFLKTVPKRTSAQPRKKRKYKPRKPKNVD